MDILIILVIILFFLIMVMLYMFVKKFSEQNEIIFKEINKLKQQIKDDLPKYNNDLIKNQLEKTFNNNENNTYKKQDIQVNKNNIEDINNKDLNNNIINNQTIINDVDKDIKLNSEDINEYPNPQDLLSDNNNEIKNENKTPLEEIEQQYLNKIKNDCDKKHKEDEELEELHNEIEESINNMNNEEEIYDDIDIDVEENNNKFINDIISLHNIIENNISDIINQEYNNKEPGALAPAKSSLCEDEPGALAGGETSCLKGINSLEHIIEEVNDEEDIKNEDNKEKENEINNNDNNIIKENEEIKEENETLYNNEILDDLINGPYKYQELVKKCKEYNIIVAKMKKKEIIDLLQSLKK